MNHRYLFSPSFTNIYANLIMHHQRPFNDELKSRSLLGHEFPSKPPINVPKQSEGQQFNENKEKGLDSYYIHGECEILMPKILYVFTLHRNFINRFIFSLSEGAETNRISAKKTIRLIYFW